ncbi:serine/threonine protein kinase [Desulfuromonas soudanensis]|uniref:Serine/threonine protein kinase n=1 Tax=Desulfuromonas soudanensis TaxID=1603606 RepID=A0A0M4DH85_9BACT|nr:protein kinase [Desulfuromonas soudanensis]ALC16375.1 serine/threonine protein kinase [Desulfuromonas soudanensis]
MIADFLIESLLGAELNSRFINIKCLNYPPPSGQPKRGYFSIVFAAKDKQTGKDVVIKFMDPDSLANDYRINCFKREPRILKVIKDVPRCLQLVEELCRFNIMVNVPGSSPFKVPCDYFVTEYIENDIDEYFFSEESNSTLEKLVLFRQIVNSVEAIHRKHIFHRDLKPDNMRSRGVLENRIVYVIDFGTAARYDSAKILDEYGVGFHVGANMYSAPEAFLGFSGDREIAKYTDFYALGCILYELFNERMYFVELDKNPNFRLALNAMAYELNKYSSREEKIKSWNENINRIKRMVRYPHFQGGGCSAERSIIDMIINLQQRLCAFDFNNRLSDFESIRVVINKSISVIMNEKDQQRILARKDEIKRNKILKIQKKNEKLNRYLLHHRGLEC